MYRVLFLSLLTLCSANINFEDKSFEFQHLVVDERSGDIFVGAVNRIYELSDHLVLKKWVSTGPVFHKSELINNENKVLLIDDSRRLVVCGTALGVCSTRNLRDINIGCDVPISVVPKEDVSTVTFLAAGPTYTNRSSRILYLGTEVGHDKEIPTLSGRLLDKHNDFRVVSTTVETDEYSKYRRTDLKLNFLYNQDVNIKYVYRFGSGISSYFLKNQKKNDGEWHSVIARVCQDDDNFHNTYTEIPIVCQSNNNATYNVLQTAFVGKPGKLLAESLHISINDDVLFAAFNVNSENSSSLDKTALCVFSLENIRKKFADNIQKCFNGEASNSLVNEPVNCLKTTIKVNYEDFCRLEANTPLAGDIPVEGTTVMYFDSKVPALISKRVRDHTVVIAGTTTGHIKKIVVDNTTTAVEYQDIIVEEGKPINKDLVLNPKNGYLYVMTKNKVSRLPIQECTTKSYTECFQDLHCGWCGVNRKCTSELECKYDDPLLWVSSDSESQAVITEVTPDNIFITSETLLTIKTENVDLKEDMYCSFMLFGLSYITNATKVGQDIQCSTPKFNVSATKEQGLDPLPVKLSLHHIHTEPALAATTVTFIDCNCFSSCTECISNDACSWCVYANRCTRESGPKCEDDVFVSQNIKPVTVCPSIVPSDLQMYIPSGEEFNFHVKVQLVGTFMIQSRFFCNFHVEDGQVTALGRLLGDTIYCEKVHIEYKSSVPEMTVPFDIIWGNGKKLDDPQKTNIIVYKCEKMANTLDSCEKVSKAYGCKWCENTNQCLSEKNC